MNLAEGAAAYRAMAERCQESLALDCAKAGAKEYLAGLEVTTPVRSGALRASEHVDAVFGSGEHATAIVAPHIIYAQFRNDGGTIRAKPGLGAKGMRPHTLHWAGGGFPLSVTQVGSRYMERAEDEVRGAMPAAMAIIVSDYLTI